MALEHARHSTENEQHNTFASQFLEVVETPTLAKGHYDRQSQIFVRDSGGEPALIDFVFATTTSCSNC
jgi:hypothetical protein